MGIETSVPFGCTFKALPGGDQPATECTPSIDRQLDEVHRWACARWSWSTSSTTPCRRRRRQRRDRRRRQRRELPRDRLLLGHAALRARRPPSPTTRTRWPRRRSRAEPAGRALRRDRAALDATEHAGAAALPAAGPLQRPRPDHARRAHHRRRWPTRHMIFDPDHMSVEARNSALDQLEAMHYPGVVSSHSWSTPDAYPRIYRSAASSRRTPATRPGSSRSGAPTSAGPTSATTGASATAPT